MTDRDNLREHLATTIEAAIREWHTHECPCSKVEHVAQAIIDEFELTVEYEQSWFVGLRDANGMLIKDAKAARIVGKWVEQ